MIEEKVISYIAQTQPKLEKYASQHRDFHKKLSDKLANLKKSGAISQQEHDKIFKEASDNPSAIFKYLEIPTFNRQIGTVDNKISVKSDPFVDFVMS